MTDAQLTQEQQARADVICEQVADGLTVRQIADGFGVSPSTVIRWVTLNEKISEQYARAREAASDLFENDIYDAAMAVTPDTATADRVKIDALKWIAARRAPKRYGDKVTTEHTGPNGGPIQLRDVSEYTDAELAALIDDHKG
jgi:transcriptional regulator with XRE-family HTH domain